MTTQDSPNPDWGKAVDKLWSGEDKEVAYIARMTGRRPIDVRRAFMEVGPDRSRVIAALRETSGQA
ncbi:MAG TPA: hypothetical protein VG742_10270 [Dongiaceae bacterium]|nr:hypothetical protein [Dongiaceae bacterium]